VTDAFEEYGITMTAYTHPKKKCNKKIIKIYKKKGGRDYVM